MGYATIGYYIYDSTSLPYTLDSSFQSFTLINLTTPPTAYDLTIFVNGPDMNQSHNLLFYDPAGRIILDSTTSDTQGQEKFTHSYDGNGIITNRFYSGTANGTSSSPYQIDTITMSNGNINQFYGYSVLYNNSDPNNVFLISQDFIQMTNWSYGSQVNPLFNATLSNSLGPIFDPLLNDFISKNLPSQKVHQDSTTGPQVTVNYTWTEDAAGRITDGQGVNPATGSLEDTYKFIYQ